MMTDSFLVVKLLVKDPRRRFGCRDSGGSEVQRHPFLRQINFRMLEAGLVEPPFKPDVRTEIQQSDRDGPPEYRLESGGDTFYGDTLRGNENTHI